MSQYPWARLQTNTYTCGPNALRHALYLLGIRASVRRIAALAEISKDNVPADTTPGLVTAAGAYGCKVEHLVRNTAGLARAALSGTTAPVLFCVDRWNHWVCVARITSRHVHYLDSERPGPVERCDTWREFLSRAVVWHPGDPPRFDLYRVLRRER